MLFGYCIDICDRRKTKMRFMLCAADESEITAIRMVQSQSLFYFTYILSFIIIKGRSTAASLGRNKLKAIFFFIQAQKACIKYLVYVL